MSRNGSLPRLFRARKVLEISQRDLLVPGLMSLGATICRLLALFLLMPLVNLVLGNGLGRLSKIPGLEQLLPEAETGSRMHWIFFSIVLAVTVVQGLLASRAELSAVRAGQKAQAAAMTRIFDRLFSLEAEHDQKSAEHIARLLRTLPSKAQRLPLMARRIITSFGGFGLFLLALLLLSWQIAIVAGFVLSIFFVVFARLTARIERLESQAEDAQEASSASIHAVAENRPLVLLSGTTKEENSRILAGLHDRQHARLKLERMRRSLASWKDTASIMVLLSFVLLLPLFSGSETPSVGRLLVVVLVLRRLMASFSQVLQVPAVLHRAGLNLDAIEKFLPKEHTHAAPPARPFQGPIEDLQLNNLSFAYSLDTSAPDTLREINLALNPGLTFLVGANGSGKSTFLKLLAGLLQPTQGSIRVDRGDLSQLDLSHWHKSLSYSTARPWFFDNSILENVTYGSLQGPSNLDALAERLGLAEWISQQSQGWQTSLSDQGGQLSSGELQKLALLRTLVREPELILLDEALSALDEPSAKLQIAELRRFLDTERGSSRRAILATHRFVLIHPLDTVVVLANGQVAEQGTRQQLLANGGAFSQLLKRE